MTDKKTELYFSYSFKPGHRESRIVKKGKSLGFYWAIISYASHPCAYVAIPKGHPYFGKDYDKIDVRCNGGLTFGCGPHCMDMFANPGYCWIGWDYAHCNDYSEESDEAKARPAFEKYNFYNEKNHKWTVQEIEKEVKNVIRSLARKKKARA